MKLKLNIFYKETLWWAFDSWEKRNEILKEYEKNWFYEVKKGDTIYNIFKNLADSNNFLSLTNNPNFPKNIKVWDKISFELQDENSAELTINSKTYILNLTNNEVIDTNKEAKNTLSSMHKEILENIEQNRDKFVQKAFDLLKLWTKPELPDNFSQQTIELENQLLWPKYKNNPEAERALKILSILNLDTSISIDKAFNKISSILDDPKLGPIDKHNIVKYLKEHYLWEMTKQIENGYDVVWFKENWEPIEKAHYSYMSDIWKWIELSNKLTKKYPKYNFENYQMIADPEWGLVYTNNF